MTRQNMQLYKCVVGALLLIPAATIFWGLRDLAGLAPGSDAYNEVTDHFIESFGLWTFRLLVLTLCISPIVRFTKVNSLLLARRQCGIAAFLYALCHFSAYFVFLADYEIYKFMGDFLDRKYQLPGFIALLLMVPLFVTSFGTWRRRLGQAWNRLHMLAYPAVILGWIHYVIQIRFGYLQALVYLALLLALALERWHSHQRSTSVVTRETETRKPGSL